MPMQAPSPTGARPDPRILRSEAAIQRAVLTRLRAVGDFRSLTVSEIAGTAGVTRKTFYSRYGTLGQVVESLVLDIFNRIADRIDDSMLVLPLTDNSLARRIFAAYQDHRDVLTLLIRCCPAGLLLSPVRDVVGRVLDRTIVINRAPPMTETSREYLVGTVSSMFHSVLSTWVRRGFSESPDQVAGFMDALLADGLQKVVLSPPL
jgi:AcrR family transcriptional regulator